MAEINWLEQVKLDAEKITLRRIKDDEEKNGTVIEGEVVEAKPAK